MNILDGNFPDDQRELLVKYHVPFQQIGQELAVAGTTDENLVALFHSLRRVTFFTQDQDFSTEACVIGNTVWYGSMFTKTRWPFTSVNFFGTRNSTHGVHVQEQSFASTQSASMFGDIETPN